jgi:hypothetical protein
LATDKLNDD